MRKYSQDLVILPERDVDPWFVEQAWKDFIQPEVEKFFSSTKKLEIHLSVLMKALFRFHHLFFDKHLPGYHYESIAEKKKFFWTFFENSWKSTSLFQKDPMVFENLVRHLHDPKPVPPYDPKIICPCLEDWHHMCREYVKVKIMPDESTLKTLVKTFLHPREQAFGTGCGGPVSSEIASYNHIIEHIHEDIVCNQRPIEMTEQKPDTQTILSQQYRKMWEDRYGEEVEKVKHRITVKRILFEEPQIQETNEDQPRRVLPQECRLRALTYRAPVYFVLSHIIMDAESGEVLENHEEPSLVTHIPVMVGSTLCPTSRMTKKQLLEANENVFETGGYLIISGEEKQVIIGERWAANKMTIFEGEEEYVLQLKLTRSARTKDGIGGTAFTLMILNQDKSIKGGGCAFGEHVIRCYLPSLHISDKVKKKDKAIDIGILFQLLGIPLREAREWISLGDPCIRDFIDASFRICEENIDQDELYKSFLENFMSRFVDQSNKNTPDNLKNLSPVEYIRARIQFYLKEKLLPHMGRNIRKKAIYLSLLIRQLILCKLGDIPKTSNNDWGCKRGIIMGMRASTALSHALTDIRRKLQTSLSNSLGSNTFDIRQFSGIVYEDTMLHLFKHMQQRQYMKRGEGSGDTTVAASDLSETRGVKTGPDGNSTWQPNFGCNILDKISLGRRVTTSITNKQMTGPREYHQSQVGIMCPVETPETDVVGLTKNPCLFSGFTPYSIHIPFVQKLLKKSGLLCSLLHDKSDIDADRHTPVLLCGKFVGFISSPDIPVLQKLVVSWRRNIDYLYHMSISIQPHVIELWTDWGRAYRPLSIVDSRDGKTSRLQKHHILMMKHHPDLWNWDTLRRHHIIEFLSQDELNNTSIRVGFTPDEPWRKNVKPNAYSHIEVDRCAIIGLVASTLPMLSCNYAPRNIFTSCFGKQAVGLGHVSNPESRFDSRSYLSVESERSPISTACANGIDGISSLPMGLTLRVMVGNPFEISEDCFVVKEGVFASINSKSYSVFSDEVNSKSRKGGGTRLENPDPKKTIGRKHANYSLLDSSGLVSPGTFVTDKDIIIGCTGPLQTKQKPEDGSFPYDRRDQSVSLQLHTHGTVGKVMLTERNQGCLARVRVDHYHQFEAGDKIANGFGQKGTGIHPMPARDLPFTEDGFVPDIIMGECCITSRMTPGMSLSMCMGTVAMLTGNRFLMTPFYLWSDLSKLIAYINQVFKEHGLPTGKNLGKQVFRDGRTGKVMHRMMPCGYLHEWMLKHFVADKIHCRVTGPIHPITKQPVAGKKDNGATRFGEMEKDVFLSSGAAFNLQQRMGSLSDPDDQPVCRCGFKVYKDFLTGEVKCRYCGRSGDENIVQVPLTTGWNRFTSDLNCIGFSTFLIPREDSFQKNSMAAPAAVTMTAKPVVEKNIFKKKWKKARINQFGDQWLLERKREREREEEDKEEEEPLKKPNTETSQEEEYDPLKESYEPNLGQASSFYNPFGFFSL